MISPKNRRTYLDSIQLSPSGTFNHLCEGKEKTKAAVLHFCLAVAVPGLLLLLLLLLLPLFRVKVRAQ